MIISSATTVYSVSFSTSPQRVKNWLVPCTWCSSAGVRVFVTIECVTVSRLRHRPTRHSRITNILRITHYYRRMLRNTKLALRARTQVATLFIIARADSLQTLWSVETGSFPKSLLENKMYDFEHLLAVQEKSVRTDYIIFLLFSLRIFKITFVSKSVSLFFKSLLESIVEVVSYISTAMLTIVVFATLGWISYGAYYDATDTLRHSFVYHLLWFVRGYPEKPDYWQPFKVYDIDIQRISFFVMVLLLRAIWIAFLVNLWMDKASSWRRARLGTWCSSAKILIKSLKYLLYFIRYGRYVRMVQTKISRFSIFILDFENVDILFQLLQIRCTCSYKTSHGFTNQHRIQEMEGTFQRIESISLRRRGDTCCIYPR